MLTNSINPLFTLLDPMLTNPQNPKTNQLTIVKHHSKTITLLDLHSQQSVAHIVYASRPHAQRTPRTPTNDRRKGLEQRMGRRCYPLEGLKLNSHKPKSGNLRRFGCVAQFRLAHVHHFGSYARCRRRRLYRLDAVYTSQHTHN